MRSGTRVIAHHRARVSRLLVLAAALAVFGISTAAAHGAGTSQPRPFGGEAQRILDFWTPDRMAQAKPLVQHVEGGVPAQGMSAGPQYRIDGTSRSDGTMGNGWWDPSMGQWKMVGRLYVYERQYGRYGWCSATAVASHNESVVWTAGHCVKDSKWYSNMLFVPAQNGPKSHPFGRWPISELYTTPMWAQHGSCGEARPYNCPYGSDYGAAIAYRRANGTSLEDVVGSLGMWFGAGLTNRTILALGYPADPPYFDKHEGYLFYCYNPVTRYQADGFGAYDWVFPCNMTGGASGGPWLTQSGSAWYLVANTSWGDGEYGAPDTILGGPYLDPSRAHSFYDYVQSGSSDKACVVPRLRGKRLRQAKRALRRHHCWLGRVHHRSSRLPRGRVISQRTVLSTQRTHGSNAVGIFVFTNVNLVVSRGRR